MEVVLVTDGGLVDARLRATGNEHTLADLAGVVLGHARTDTIAVDGRPWPGDTTLVDAGLQRGSRINLTHDTGTDTGIGTDEGLDLSETDAQLRPRLLLIERAGWGGQRRVVLTDGVYRIGPTRRINAPHLASGPVDDALVVIDVAGDVVTIDAASGYGAALDGDLLLGPTRWTGGPLVIDDRIFERRPPSQAGDELSGLRTARRLAQLPIGRSLVPDDRAATIELDADAGIGIIADPDDALAMLRSIVLAAAIGDTGPISIASDRPQAWEWTKWLPQVRPGAIVALGPDQPAGLADGDREPAELLIIDRTDPDTLPLPLPAGTAVVATAATASMLPAQLGSIVEPVGAGRATAVRATTIVDGAPVEHRRLAPHTVDHELALDAALRLARDHDADDVGEASSPRLTIEPWYVTRAATPTERRALRWRSGDRAHVTVDVPRPAPSSPDTVIAAGSIDATRFIVPIGVWADRRTVATLPLPAGRPLAVFGPESTRRRQLLALVLDGIGQATRPAGLPVDLFALAPHDGTAVSAERRERLSIDVADEARDVRDWLERVAAAPRPFVVIDGADRVGGPSLRWLASDDFRHATVVLTAAAEPDQRHWSAPWHDRWMTMHLHADDAVATVESRHRTREVLIVELDDAPEGSEPAVAADRNEPR